MNRLTGITYPDGSSVSFGYDYRGRRTSVTDQNQKTTSYTYDDADRLTAVTDPANNTTYYAYDDCYTKYNCNASSFLGGLPFGPCQLSNLVAETCILFADKSPGGGDR
jgi:YD repeat-containing protein